MFFHKKLDRSYDTLRFLGDRKGEETEEDIKEFKEREKLEFKDILAMIISALIVFGPLFLIIGLLMFLIINNFIKYRRPASYFEVGFLELINSTIYSTINYKAQ